jgi:HAMP domain-containing protein
MEQNNQALYNSVSRWMNMNLNALQQMVSVPGIRTMQAAEQKPILDSMAVTYPHMYLVSTTNLAGVNIARSDDAELTDYSDRLWFQGAASGEQFAFQTLIGRTSGEPALVAATPIRDESGTVIGVGMFAADLTIIAEEVNATHLGETGFAYLVNENGLVLAHPDTSLSQELVDYSSYYPVARALEGYRGFVEFTDDSGTEWQGYVRQLGQGWGLVVQQETSEVLQSFNSFQRLSLYARILALAAILVLVWFVTGRTLRPIAAMTEVATAVSQGDFSQTVPFESDDELGILARAFNLMVKQINDFFAELEDRISVRTQALQTSTEVSRRLSTLLDQEQLVAEMVHQVQRAFDYYHVHIYLLDEETQDLAMAGGTGEAGRALLSKGHRLAWGKGLVGRCAANNEVVLISNVAEAENWLPNPYLPDTKTELAVPIAIGEQVLGVLDVQDVEVGKLDEEDVHLLQSVSNQVAVALRNARLYETVQKRADHEAVVNQINQQLLSAPTMERVLEIAAQGLGKYLGVRRATIQLSRVANSNGRHSGEKN